MRRREQRVWRLGKHVFRVSHMTLEFAAAVVVASKLPLSFYDAALTF